MKGLRGFYICFLFFFIIYGSGQAQDLKFPEVLEQALANSYDLKTSRLGIEISSEQLKEAKAIYYPGLTLGFSNEYAYSFEDDTNNIVSVGETIIRGNESSFQHSVSLSAQYLLYDFGKRRLTYRNLQRDVVLAQYAAEQSGIDYAVEVLSVYGAGLQLQKNLKTWAAISELRKAVYQFTKRLVVSGSKGRMEQGIAAITMAEALQRCETLRLEITDVLEKLSFYTGQDYQTTDILFFDFPDKTDGDAIVDVSMLPAVRAYDVAIEQKKAEIAIARRHWLPMISLYTSYRMYGNDTNSYVDSLKSLKEETATIGFVVNMNLFNGFSDEAKLSRLNKELQRLEVKKAKETAKNDQKVRTLVQKSILSKQGLGNANAYRIVLNDQEIMEKRLSGQQIIDRISLLQQKEEQMEKHLTLALADVERCMIALHLKILAGEDF